MNGMAQLLKEMFPEHTPEERYVEWQKMNLGAIEAGWLVATLLPDGRIMHTHIDNATPEQMAVAMTPVQYRLWMDR